MLKLQEQSTFPLFRLPLTPLMDYGYFSGLRDCKKIGVFVRVIRTIPSICGLVPADSAEGADNADNSGRFRHTFEGLPRINVPV